jgi:hypothetical protein
MTSWGPLSCHSSAEWPLHCLGQSGLTRTSVFPNSVLGTTKGARFFLPTNTTQLIQIIKVWPLVDYLNQLCGVRGQKHEACTPWGPKELGKPWGVHPLSMFGVLWIDGYSSVFQFPPISRNFAKPLKRSGTIFYRPQSTPCSTLWKADVWRCMGQIVVTTDTDWFSDPCPYLFLKVSVTNRCISVFPVMWNP